MDGSNVCPVWAAAGWDESYQRILGEELRKLREQRGWTRRRLQTKLGLDVSLPTLTTYELGTRQVGAVRLVQICLALGEDIGELLARVHGRLGSATVDAATVDAACWVVDLAEAAECNDPRLLPLRGWARSRLAVGQSGTVQVYLSGLRALAVLCDVDVLELTRLLPQPTSSAVAAVVPLRRPTAMAAPVRPRDHCEPATVDDPLASVHASDDGG